MINRTVPTEGVHLAIVESLSKLQHGQLADFFAQLLSKKRALKRDGSPYYSVTFRDRTRQVRCAIWEGSPLETDCKEQWQEGKFYKIRARYDESIFGGSIRIERLREVNESDSEHGFAPSLCVPSSAYDAYELYEAVLGFAEERIVDPQIFELVREVYSRYQELIVALPASLQHHHAYAGGFLEHVLSVAGTVVDLIDRYRGQHASLRDPLIQDLAISGALLHDIGKVLELDSGRGFTRYSEQGELIGHVTLGRDMVRQVAQELSMDSPWLTRLEHLILSHQGNLDSNAFRTPMTWEANLVYWADELDGNIFRLATAWQTDTNDHHLIPTPNPIGRKLYKHGADNSDRNE